MEEKEKLSTLRLIQQALNDIQKSLDEINRVNSSIQYTANNELQISYQELQNARDRISIMKSELEQKLKILNATNENVQSTRQWSYELANVQAQLADIYRACSQLDRTSRIVIGSSMPMEMPASFSGDSGESAAYLNNIYALLATCLPAIQTDVSNFRQTTRMQLDTIISQLSIVGANIPVSRSVNEFSGASQAYLSNAALNNIAYSNQIMAQNLQEQNKINHRTYVTMENMSARGASLGAIALDNGIDIDSASQSSMNWWEYKKNAMKTSLDVTFSQNPVLQTVKTIGDGLLNATTSIRDTVISSMEQVTDLLVENSGKTDSRLYGLMTDIEGLNVNFVNLGNDVISLVSETRSMGLLNEQDILSNIVTLVNQGVAFNIEQRALWMSLTDKIVSTFSVTNDTLLRSIQLQQTELTDTYMGMEASITRILNSMYKDTQYLENDYDVVWGNLQDLIANTTSDLGAELVYQIQVWLGSLSSLGLSSNATNGISQAINSMLTGNISGLGDTGKVLLAMSAADANMSLADLLVNGMSSGEDMNKFFQSMLKVLQDIYSQSKDNNVLLSEWGDVLDLSISDWKAISNLQSSQIKTLASMANYSQKDALDELKNIEDVLVSERTLIAERADNLAKNTIFEAGWDFATSETDYVIWYLGKQLTSFLSNMAGQEGTMFYNETLAGLASAVSDATNVMNTVTASIVFLDPMIDALATAFGSNILSDMTYSQFKNTSVNGTVGDFSSELFSYLVNAKGYINYKSIMDGSFSETQSHSNVMSKWASAYNLENITSDDIMEMIKGSSSYNSTTGTDSVGTSGTGNTTSSSSSDTATTIGIVGELLGASESSATTSTQRSSISYQTANNTTVSNASANPENKTTTNTIDTLYTLLATTKTGEGIHVYLAGVDKNVVMNVKNTPILSTGVSVGGVVDGVGSATAIV